MLNGLAAGIFIVDFSFHLVKAALCLFVPGGKALVFLVVVRLVLRHMGVLADAVLYQPCDDIQLIGQFRPFLFEGGGVEDRIPDKPKGLDDRVLVGESLVRRRYERRLYLIVGQVRRGAFLVTVLVVAPPDDLAVLVGAVPDLRAVP